MHSTLLSNAQANCLPVCFLSLSAPSHLSDAMASIDRVRVSVPVWDSDKDPGGYRKWATVVAGMVRSCKGSLELESFKEQKMGVPQSAAKIVSSFLSNDPDFSETHE